MRVIFLILGIIAVLLGALWLLQGLGLVHIRPILCVADCAPIEGRSVTWAVIGFVMLMAGVFAIFRTLKR